MKIKNTAKTSLVSRFFSTREKLVLIFIHVILVLLLVCSFSSCKEENIGQYPIDNIPPQKISNPVVMNKKGGATIKYDLPLDEDLLYVKAVYKLPNGEQKETLAPDFVNTLSIKVFARSAKTNVQLMSVDRSKNESEPVVVEIVPLDSPISD